MKHMPLVEELRSFSRFLKDKTEERKDDGSDM